MLDNRHVNQNHKHQHHALNMHDSLTDIGSVDVNDTLNYETTVAFPTEPSGLNTNPISHRPIPVGGRPAIIGVGGDIMPKNYSVSRGMGDRKKSTTANDRLQQIKRPIPQIFDQKLPDEMNKGRRNQEKV